MEGTQFEEDDQASMDVDDSFDDDPFAGPYSDGDLDLWELAEQGARFFGHHASDRWDDSLFPTVRSPHSPTTSQSLSIERKTTGTSSTGNLGV